ncbi:MAG: GGDEF domain-containing protein [Gammaproteobacteria bacterium]|nr:MAG: GGDEF domain-containing protein [Gammaproteobacteria bacterium]TLZ12936.1 MAG: GGDEF domain-containing protein [Gammaproteobacteria bacterium]TLZ13907.1 MAG: GGDEF domain-containing protein [Gammaproteobacteria bacterium]TLZ20697.1 MAG: GGDEF domain-containing protein [Gammaproteobacteria bacterium]TLZ24532.1 MAG: GGDEF domain-containing protein [Gammaproteobacteria bacterium]
MDTGSVQRSAEGTPRTRNSELAGELRAAAVEGDDVRVTQLLSDLLHLQGLSRGQRISMQLTTLLNMVHSLRCVTLTDELTGLFNRRGFVQSGTRLLDVASRDVRAAHLIYFDLNHLERINQTMGRSTGDVMIRQMGNFMRDLFPSYGVYEVLGRLSGDEFATLTMSPQYASRGAILLRAARTPQEGGTDLPPLSLSVGVAHFNPRRPLSIDKLLESAEQAMYEHKKGLPDRVVRDDPPPGLTRF